MKKLMQMLNEKGIPDKIRKVVEEHRDLSLTDILEYEISQDENLEDEFLSVAHSMLLDAIIFEILGEPDIPEFKGEHRSCMVKEIEMTEEDLKDFLQHINERGISS